MTEQKTTVHQNSMNRLLTLIKACPHIVGQGIGAEKFAEDLIKSVLKFDAYSVEIVTAINNFFPFITTCPQIFQPGTGIEAFLDDFSKAAVIFDAVIRKTGNIET